MSARRSARSSSFVAVGALLVAPLVLAGSARAADPTPVQVVPPAGVVLGGDSTGLDLSADGRWVAYAGSVGTTHGLHVTDLTTGEARTLLTGSTPIGDVSISADGNRVAYVLGVPGFTLDGEAQVRVHDRAAGTDTLVSATRAGAPGNATSWSPALSADGTTVAFTTRSTNLAPGTEGSGTDVVVKVLATGAVELVSGVHARAGAHSPTISADGNRIAFVTERRLTPDDTDDHDDVVVRTRSTQAVTLASPGADAAYASAPAISADGKKVAHLVAEGGRPELIVSGVFVTDLATGAVVRASTGDHGTTTSPGIVPAISADGRFVLFTGLSSATGPDGRAVEAYVRDLASGTTRWVSTAAPPSAFAASGVEISGSGRHVLFSVLGVNTLTAWTSDLGEPEPLPTPANVGLPVVGRFASGVGYALRVVKEGSWTGAEVAERSYQWLRDGEPIPGAVGRQYAVTRADRGARLAVRESVTGPGPVTAVAESRGLRATKAASRTKVRVSRPKGRSGRVVLDVRVGHDWNLRPQGRLVVRWGQQTRVRKVDADGRVRLRLAPGRAGRHSLVVRHRGTVWVKAAAKWRRTIRVHR